LGAIAAAAQLATQSIEILQRVQTALNRQKNGAIYLQTVSLDLTQTITIAELVRDEDQFQGNSIRNAIEGVLKTARVLDEFVQKLDEECQNGRGFRRFTHNLTQGPAEQKKVEEMRAELMHAKSTLSLAIQVAEVGLIRNMGHNDVVVNVFMIQSLNDRVREYPGLEGGLRISDLLKARGVVMENGEVHLEEADLAALNRPPPYHRRDNIPPGAKALIVEDSTAKKGAIMLNAQVGKPGSHDRHDFIPLDYVRISNATAEENSLMLNNNNSIEVYGMTLNAYTAVNRKGGGSSVAE
jgi:hypothetical protein